MVNEDKPTNKKRQEIKANLTISMNQENLSSKLRRHLPSNFQCKKERSNRFGEIQESRTCVKENQAQNLKAYKE